MWSLIWQILNDFYQLKGYVESIPSFLDKSKKEQKTDQDIANSLCLNSSRKLMKNKIIQANKKKILFKVYIIIKFVYSYREYISLIIFKC